MAKILYDRIVDVGLFKSWEEDTIKSNINLGADAASLLYGTSKLDQYNVTEDSNKLLDPLNVASSNAYIVNTGGKEGFAIVCNDMQLKPNIHVNLSILPDNYFYNCTITIKNLNHINDIMSYRIMHVRLGYRYSTTNAIANSNHRSVAEFKGPIFRSYQTTANPDGETVFEGVLVGEVLDPLKRRPIKFTCHPLKNQEDEKKNGTCPITVGQFLKFLQLSTGGDVKYDPNKLDTKFDKEENNPIYLKKLNDDYVETSVGIETACKPDTLDLVIDIASLAGAPCKTFIQLIAKAAEILRTQLESTLHHQVSLCYLNDKIVFVEMSGGYLKVDTTYVYVKYLYTASFSASILTVTAPYDPRITTGTLVRISPRLFNGSKLTNEFNLVTEIYGPALAQDKVTLDDLNHLECFYTVLHMNVDFGTYEGNTMELLCLPISTQSEMQPIEEQKTTESYNGFLSQVKAVLADEEETRELIYGEKEEPPEWTSDVYSELSDDELNLSDYDLYEDYGGYVVKPNDRLSGIVRKRNSYKEKGMPGLFWSWDAGRYGDKNCKGYIRSNQNDNLAIEANDSNSNSPVSLQAFKLIKDNNGDVSFKIITYYLWPCIIAITRKYASMSNHKKFRENCAIDFSGTGHNVDVDTIAAGGLLMLPINYYADSDEEASSNKNLQESVYTIESKHKNLYLYCAKYVYDKLRLQRRNCAHSPNDLVGLLNMYLFLGGKLTDEDQKYFGGIQGWKDNL